MTLSARDWIRVPIGAMPLMGLLLAGYGLVGDINLIRGSAFLAAGAILLFLGIRKGHRS